jgi:hypothetical protein
VFSTKKNNYFEQIHQFAVDSIISSVQEDTSPETICKDILSDYVEHNATRKLFCLGIKIFSTTAVIKYFL